MSKLLFLLLCIAAATSGEEQCTSGTVQDVKAATSGTYNIQELSISGRSFAFQEDEVDKVRVYLADGIEKVFDDAEDVELAKSGEVAAIAFHNETLKPAGSTCDSGLCAEVVRVFETKDWVQIGADIVVETANEYILALNDVGDMVAIRTAQDTVKVFKLSNEGQWLQLGVDIPGAAADLALANSGTRIAVSSTELFTGNGRVAIYSLVKNGWILEREVQGGSLNDRFGKSISMNDDGTVLAVGSVVGTVTVLTLKSTWEQSAVIESPSDKEDHFGYTVAIAGDGRSIVIGARSHDAHLGLTRNGRVYLYREGNNVWALSGSMDGAELGGQLGNSVAIDNEATWMAAGTWASSNFVRFTDIDCKATQRNDDDSPITTNDSSSDSSLYTTLMITAVAGVALVGGVFLSLRFYRRGSPFKDDATATDEDFAATELAVF